MSGRLNQEREERLQPVRIQTAIKELQKLGIQIRTEDKTKITFIFKEQVITYFAYSGWHTGKGIKDGRGLQNLLKQLK